jgi:hypothetical protein
MVPYYGIQWEICKDELFTVPFLQDVVMTIVVNAGSSVEYRLPVHGLCESVTIETSPPPPPNSQYTIYNLNLTE